MASLPTPAPPLTPADPRFHAYWAQRTAAEAHAAGVSQIAKCRDAVYTPAVLAWY